MVVKGRRKIPLLILPLQERALIIKSKAVDNVDFLKYENPRLKPTSPQLLIGC